MIMGYEVEYVENYKPGGYHPIDIGDTITNGDDIYTVAHKLGYGGFSTVWLVKRQRRDSAGQEVPVSFHALKVLRADLDNTATQRADRELDFLQRLGQMGRSSHPNILMLEDSFNISGPNGQHRCLVFPVLGPSLRKSSNLNKLSPSQRHHACQQLTSAVAFLHSHDVCHGGKAPSPPLPMPAARRTTNRLSIHADLTPANIVFEIPDMQSMTESHLLELLGPIRTETLRLRKGPVPHSKHGPKNVVKPASFSGLDISSLTTVQIIDFGCAFLNSNPPPTLGCPVEFFPPELLFDFPASTKSDIWQLAAIIYLTYSGIYMFQTGFQLFHLLIPFVVDFHGPVPSQWKGKFVWSKYGTAPPGEQAVPQPEPDYWYDETQPTRSFEDRIAKQVPYLSEAQRNELKRLLNDMVTWEPGSRISAAGAGRRLDDSSVWSSIHSAQLPPPKPRPVQPGFPPPPSPRPDSD